MMIGHFAGKLMSKYKIGGAQANSVAGNLIPNVISNLISKSNEPANNGFSLENLLNSITGGQTAQVVQEQQAGANSGFNFQDLIGQFTGGGQQNGGGGGGHRRSGDHGGGLLLVALVPGTARSADAKRERLASGTQLR